ncbi:protein NPAT isoform X2 [Dunckerocampus dactyliophorus]|uniref:protein NPAT isoform X2 n=1 Tax=Dunckerocampus dactyliophorus TaxID=161453 RepID=UPI002404E6D7|nr:protein NPAT isoform X2 [Dunckerocampus dactyliophorus]
MLLPSDVARLVLGYLQEEGLSDTSLAFIQESPNLKEYAEHTMGDGAVPACVFSIFGKGLTTILNEYMAAKTKETCSEVPAVMTSLWKKLDFTLKQIKSLQSSPAISASQRARSRVGLANLARQQVLSITSGSSVVCSSISETALVNSPAVSSQCVPSHSTPLSYSAPQIRAPSGSATPHQFHDGSRSLSIQRDSPVQIIVTEQRLNPGPMSPGRRKWDTPRKRSCGVGGSGGSAKFSVPASNVNAEPQPEEAVDENFPQLVIQNARDKILGDRSLQEKLAENINKILANEPTPLIPKAPSSSVEDDQSIDEILGLQGEIHMSDDAIHDILEQTESDPAFQALFDLFDYNKTRTDGGAEDVDMSSAPEENDTAGPPPSTAGQLPGNTGPATTEQESSCLTPVTLKNTAVQERKTRKPTTLLKKTVLGSSSRSSRLENSSARLLITHEEHCGEFSSTLSENGKEKLFPHTFTPSPLDIDNTMDTSLTVLESTASVGAQDSLPTLAPIIDLTAIPASRATATVAPVIYVNNQSKQAQGSQAPSAAALSSPLNNQPAFLSPVQHNLSADLPPTSLPSSGGNTQPLTFLVTPQSSTGATLTDANAAASNAGTCSTGTLSASSKSGIPGAAASGFVSSNIDTPSKVSTDSSNIVSLKIIISDNQDEDSSSDKALNPAISNIPAEKIPTIYLSSPAKSPRGPGTPRSTNLDETALAVCGLQSSEALANSPCKAGALVPSHQLAATTQAQQSYIIQLPLDTVNPALQGTTTSYLLMTEQLTADAAARQSQAPAVVSKGPLMPKTNQYSVTAATPPQGFVSGSALILPSPVKPMMLPMTIMGQNGIGKVQMVANQLVGIPTSVPMQQNVTVEPNPPIVAVKQSTTGGTLNSVVGQNLQNETKDASASHKRILCFESPTEVQPPTSKPATTATSSVTNTMTSQNATQTKKGHSHVAPRTRPAILGGNKPKRKVETIRCSADHQTSGNLVMPISPQQQENNVKTNSTILNQESQTASGSGVGLSQPESVKNSEPGSTSKPVAGKHSLNKDGAQTKDSGSSKSLLSVSELKCISSKEKYEGSRKEPEEEQIEKKTLPQDKPKVTANKENEVIGSSQEQLQLSTSSSLGTSDLGPPAVTPSKSAKIPSKTKSLAKQAAEMLQNIQGLSSPHRPGKKSGISIPDLTGLRTHGAGNNQEESVDCPRTPLQQKKGKDAEGTPKNVLPHNTPDVPTCSPASEAGSENSINMAAHTLMILSRAAIARTGTPLKDSLRQEEVGEKSPPSLKNSKKRKQSPSTASPPAKKASKQSPDKKKDRQRKKLINCFPHDLDVDKFLSSLHYDE